MLMQDPVSARRFILAGKATVTLKSLASGDHYTYRVSAVTQDRHIDGGIERYVEREEPWKDWFVRLLTDGDVYVYIGMIRKYPNGTHFLHTTAKSKMSQDSKPVKAMNYALQFLDLDPPTIHRTLEIYHDGKCGRCRRQLTRPDSITIGIGPECAKVMGITHPLNCEAA